VADESLRYLPASRSREDPDLKATRHWIARRLAPDCSRIDLAQLPKQRQEVALFRAMGLEIANVHCGSQNVVSLRWHLASLDRHWLRDSSVLLHSQIRSEFRQWRRHR
jgi:hypothetical protein